MKTISYVIAIFLSLVLISGCVSNRVFETEMQSRDERITSLETEIEMNESRIDKHENQLAELSVTTREAYERAEEAGQLAKGKFLYEIVLSEDRCKFGLDQWELGNECQAILDEFVSRIKIENKPVFIEIQGHTDASGDEAYNQLIGQRRAESVYRYLASSGIPLHKMNVISYGEKEPIADNSTPEGRRANRRVVVVVLE
ncbi:OmpA family protein [bacterium]|nr:OmpA family protein [candidate division CSSED10-310 bacterium]